MSKEYMTKEKIRWHIDSFLKGILNSQENRIILVWEAEEILKLIQKQQGDLEKKDNVLKDYMENELYLNAVIADQDKVINKMAETIFKTYYNDPDSVCSEVDLDGARTAEDVKQYFKEKVEE